MISAGVALLERRFSIAVGVTPPQQNNVTADEDDMSAIEMFYASTTDASTFSQQEDTVPFLVDESRGDIGDRRIRQAATMEDRERHEKAESARREHMKRRIDNTLTEEEEVHLSRYLHRHVREQATMAKVKAAALADKTASEDNPYYVSY